MQSFSEVVFNAYFTMFGSFYDANAEVSDSDALEKLFFCKHTGNDSRI